VIDREVDSGTVTEALRRNAEFAALAERLSVAVRRTAPRWLQSEVPDLVQAAVVRVLRTRGDEVNNAFLYRVAHSVIVDEIRRRGRRPEALSETAASTEGTAGPGTGSPERRAEGSQAAGAILEVLQALAVDRRRAVTLYLQGHTVPEAAQLLGFDRKKTENLVYRGLDDLRDGLRERGIEP
jgi:RNA polymerase sigma-70 factor (ECF subfamily)